MREILFRAKTVCDGDWIYGGITWNPSKKKVFIHTEWDECEVIPETVGQYTGMTDKNGKKIFENDIVKYKIIGLNVFGKMETRETKSIVKYNAPCFSPFETDLYEDYVVPEETEVIGNIHDNFELLNK